MKTFDLIKTLLFFTIKIIFLFSQQLLACSGGNLGGNISISITWQTMPVQTYTYYNFTSTSAGEIFIFSFCQGGGSNSVDTQLEVHYNNGTSTGAFNDDACSTGSELVFTSPGAGTYRISIYRYNCQTTVVSAGTLAYKRIVPNEQDCVGAITVCQATYYQNESYFGYGAILDYTSSASCPGLCVETEDKSVWYTFQVQQSGILDFRITPNLPNSDYDWALFNLTNHDCSVLQNIASNTSLIVSCNAAYDFGTTGANTLTPNTNSNCQGPSTLGQYPINNPVIPVYAGEIYYLNIQNWSATQGGYTLDFSNSTASIFDNNPPYISYIETPDCNESQIVVHFNENIDCSSISVNNFTLTGPGGPYTINSISGDACVLGGSMERIYTLTFSPAITTSGNFTISFNGNVIDMCGNVSINDTWNFTINSGANLNLTSPASTLNQNICLGNPITNITYSATAGSSCNFNGLPAGVSGNYNSSTGQIVISGTPTQTGTYNFSVSVAGSCGYVVSNGTIVVNQIVVPTFQSYGPYCRGDIPQGLPNQSLNGVSGTWSPAVINTNIIGNSTYTFTPSPGQCSQSVSIQVNVIDVLTPVFPNFGPYCLNSPSINLPTVSNNGINGTWNPPIVNTSVSGTSQYTFTPLSGQCLSNYSTNITIGSSLNVTVSISRPVNCEGNNGLVTVAASGGTPPYIGTGSFSVNAGEHTYIVNDNIGCIGEANISIPMPENINAEIRKISDVDCNGASTGSFAINITSGTAPFRLAWQNFNEIISTNSIIKNNLRAGTYNITLTDNSGCTFSGAIDIFEPSKIEVAVNAQGPSCIGNSDGFIELIIRGGTAPYVYYLDYIPVNDSLLNDLPQGNYSIFIRDANNCLLEIDNIALRDYPVVCLKIPNAFTPNNDGVNDKWIIENIDLFPNSQAWVYNRWGQIVYNDNPLTNPWDGFYNGKILPAGTYLYIIQTYKDSGSYYKGTVTILY